MKRLILLLFLIIIIADFSYSQRRRSTRWKQTRYEIVYHAGATNFLGELGGADQIGTNYLRDFEIAMSRPALGVGLRYKILKTLSVKGGLYYGIIRGDDKTTDEPARKNRNLHFRSPIIEFSPHIEWHFVSEREGHRYNLRKVRGLFGYAISMYVYTGFSVLYFNPKAKYQGKWRALQPLGTEGQGLIPTRKKYSRVTMAIPLGFGIKYKLDRNWYIGIEYNMNKTFSDYMDDVSTSYYDNDLLRAERGDMAADLADQALGTEGYPSQYQANEQRGDSYDKDTYMYMFITLTYKLRTGRNGLPKF